MRKLAKLTVLLALTLALGFGGLSIPRGGDRLVVAKADEVNYSAELFPNITAIWETKKTAAEGDDTYVFPIPDPAFMSLGSLAGDSYGQLLKDDDDVVLKLSKDEGTANFSSIFAFIPFAANGLGEYVLSFDAKIEGTTDNFGGNFVGCDVAEIPNLAASLTTYPEAADAGWNTVTINRTIVALGDSISIWFNAASGSAFLKNISLKKILPAVTIDKTSAIFNMADQKDIAFTLDMTGGSITAVKWMKTLPLTVDTDYTVTGADDATVLTIKKEYLALYGATESTTQVQIETTLGNVVVNVTIIPLQPTLPNIEAYNLVETIVNGNFEAFAEDLTFSLAQAEGAWGSVSSHDDPGMIKTVDGTKALRLKKTGDKNFSSAFVMLDPSIESGDVLTFSLEYKLDATDANVYSGKAVNAGFVSASNSDNHTINLKGTTTQTKTGGYNTFKWDITHSAGTNGEGWNKVEVSFVVNGQFKLQCDSIRFLFELVNADDALYIDNVSLKIWKDKGAVSNPPEVTEASATFNKANPADITFNVNTHGASIQKLTNVTASADLSALVWTKPDENTSFTIKKEYLLTLANGEYTFSVTTVEGTDTFVITISGEVSTGGLEETVKGLCGAVSTGSSGMSGMLMLAIGALLFMAISKRKSVVGA